jgi:methylmalonyl-CoA mutase N-terminal domain/subunit
MTLRDEKERWKKETLNPLLERYPERKDTFNSTSDIRIPRVLLPENDSQEYLEKNGFPGEYPYTRGIHPGMYRGRLWTMRQYAGYASAEESNRRYRYLLEEGQTGLSVAFDLPTQLGYDSDDPRASGEVGKVGVSISSRQDMELLFKSIPLEKVSTSMTINAPAAILLAFYIAVAKKQGADISKLRGTVQNDILKEYIARGTYIFPPEQSMRLITDLMQFCHKKTPHWNTISISGYHIREAGSNAVQEVAFTLANGIAYVQAAVSSGLQVDEFAPQISFFFNAHNDFFEEVAKFRAARRIWAKIIRERFGAKNPRSWMLRFHTQTAGSTLTAQQPENNIVRVTLQALGAIMGGTQSLHTNSMDEALWLPTTKSVRIALRTQQIIAHESRTADSVDPLAGSYLVEYLTDEIQDRVEKYIQTVDEMGGAMRAIEQGYMQSEIEQTAYEYQRALERGEQTIVGVNAYRTDEDLTLERLTVDPAIEEGQRQRLDKLRTKRDSQKVNELLSRLEVASSKANENLMPLFIACAECDVTLGEICRVLRRKWGEYQPPTWS